MRSTFKFFDYDIVMLLHSEFSQLEINDITVVIAIILEVVSISLYIPIWKYLHFDKSSQNFMHSRLFLHHWNIYFWGEGYNEPKEMQVDCEGIFVVFVVVSL